MIRYLYVQIALVFSLILIVIMVSFGVLVAEEQSERLRVAMESEMRGLVEVYGEVVARLLVVEELAGMEDTLLQAMESHDLKTVDVVRPDGSRMVGIESRPGSSPKITYGTGVLSPPDADTALFHENGSIVIWHRIVGGNHLGWLKVSKGMEVISRTQRDVWKNVLTVGCGGSVVGLFLVLAALVRPVRDIQRVRDFAINLNRCKGDQIEESATSRETLELCRALNQASRELADTERDLLREQERLGVTLESIGDGVIACDRSGRIQLMNRVAEQLTGWRSGDAAGRELGDVFSLELQGGLVELDWHAIVSTGRPGTLEPGVVLVARDGSRRNVADSIAPILTRTGEIIGFVMVFRDVSDQLAQKAHHEALQEQLLQSQKREAVGQLAGGIAHDFNNILTAIIGYAQMLQFKATGREDIAECTERILQASERAAGLTRSLLAFSRKQKMEVKAFEVNADIANIEKILRRIIGEDVELKILLHREPLVIKGDPGQIDQVLINLAANARDAMPGGGTLTIRTDRQVKSLGEAPPGPVLQLTVSDTGSGIPSEVRDRIFDPFFTTKEKGKGTGLGLSIVDSIIRQHGGEICLTSAPGAGTNFMIYMPLAAAEGELEQAQQSESAGGQETILLVEDEDDVRGITAGILESAGYRVIAARGGVEALHFLSEAGTGVSLMLTDVIMPVMNGKKLAEGVCTLVPEIRVLYMSGYTWDVIGYNGVLDSKDELIAKPFDRQQLLRRVREVLDGTAPAHVPPSPL